MEIPPLKTFICYAHQDRKAVDELRKHLAQLEDEDKKMLEIWDDGKILPGEQWDKSIKIRLEQAEIVLMFISVDFINSRYIKTVELQAVLERHREGLARLIPIIVRRCDWEEYFQIGQFQALPKQARPIYSSHFSYQDDAFHEIQQGIKRTAQDLLEKRAAQLRAEAEAAEKAQQEADASHHQEQEAERRKAAEKARAERLRKNDETAWQTALKEMEAADNERDKAIALESYLDEPEHTLHRDEAEKLLDQIKASETKRRIAEKKQQEVQRQAEEEKRRKAEAEKERQRLAEAEKARKTRHADAEMALIKGGSFDMGDTFGEGFDWEKPVHQVTVSDFHLGKYAVTVAQFKAFIEDSGYHTDADKAGGSYIWNEKKSEWAETKGVNWRCDVNGKVRPESEHDHPVIHVSWNDAQAYCAWLSEKTGKPYRLPTEAEWEYAAREGGKKVRFGNGKDIADPKEINFNGSAAFKKDYSIAGEYRQKTVPVDYFPPNALGLYQMSGNVWEWCEDWYHSDYEGAPTDGSAWLSPEGSDRVVRGGSWGYAPQFVRAAFRGDGAPGHRYGGLGFRLARTK